MFSQSPFDDFYDRVFALAAPHQQASFLRQLFTLDASLCTSFEAYINPPLWDVTAERETLNAAAIRMQEGIKRYHWDILFEVDPTAEDYISELMDLLDKEFIGTYLRKIQVSCSTGDLLTALSCLRIIEQGTNLDWETIEEPAGFYGPEVKEHIEYQFDFFISCFLHNIFSKSLINNAITWAKTFQSEPIGYFDYSGDWEEIIKICKDRI